MNSETLTATYLAGTGSYRGERALYVGAQPDLDAVTALLGARRLQVARLRENRSLVLVEQKSFCNADGRMMPDRIAEYVTGAVEGARAEGFSGFRGAGEACCGHSIDTESVLAYERSIGRFVPGKHAMLLCLYDRTKLPSDVLVPVLRLHPLAVVRGRLCENPFLDRSDRPGRPSERPRPVRLDAGPNVRVEGSGPSRGRDETGADPRSDGALAVDLERHREVVETLAHTVRTREMLIGLISRQVRAAIGPLRSGIASLLAGTLPAENILDDCHEEIVSLARLADCLDEAASFVAEPLDMQNEPTDVAELLRACVEEIRKDPRWRSVSVDSKPALVAGLTGTARVCARCCCVCCPSRVNMAGARPCSCTWNRAVPARS